MGEEECRFIGAASSPFSFHLTQIGRFGSTLGHCKQVHLPGTLTYQALYLIKDVGVKDAGKKAVNI